MVRTHIGVRSEITNLEHALNTQGFFIWNPKSDKTPRPGITYKHRDDATGGLVYVRYFQTAEIPEGESPSRAEGNIAALILVETYLGTLAGVPDKSLETKYHDIGIHLLDTYRESHGAFVYEPTPAAAVKRA